RVSAAKSACAAVHHHSAHSTISGFARTAAKGQWRLEAHNGKKKSAFETFEQRGRRRKLLREFQVLLISVTQIGKRVTAHNLRCDGRTESATAGQILRERSDVAISLERSVHDCCG